MEYDKFCDVLKRELPLNRKERFFTGTVLPALLFHDGLENFFTFISLIDGFPKEINLSATGENFLFYTEYNLQESAGSRNVGARIEVPHKDTPDVIIEILYPRKMFIVIEAKMFHNVTKAALIEQVARQKERVGRYIADHFSLDSGAIFFLALVPRKLGINSCAELQVIHWEALLDNLNNIKHNVFFNYLKYALENYEKLVSISSFGQASTVKYYMPGQEIFQNQEGVNSHWVGREGGERKFIDDITTGKWKSYKYSMNSTKPEKGRHGNWIGVQRFVELVGKYSLG